MQADVLFRLLKQRSHLLLRKPDGFILNPDLNGFSTFIRPV
jgi:hypothetical protein